MKLSRQNMELVAGILFLFFLTCFVCFAYWTKKAVGKPEAFQLYATFNKVDGVSEGTQVYLAGLPVGYVKSLELDNFFRVRTLLVFDRYLDLPDDTAVVIETSGIVGAKHIELIAGGSDEFLEAGDSIQYVQDVLLLDELLERVLQIMRDKKGVIKGEEYES